MTIYHKHHIVPKHMGGSNDPSNLVVLTVEEHALAHKELYEKYGKIEDRLAWQGLSGMMGKEEIIKDIQKENGRRVGKMSSNAEWLTGRPKSEETKKKISKTLTGRKQTQDTKDKRATAHKGRRNTPETIAKMQQAAKGRQITPEAKAKMSEARKKWWAAKNINS
jgi:hypothetical protein